MAARRSSDGILGKTGAGVEAARRSSSGILGETGAAVEAARRSSSGFLDGGRSHNRVTGINQVRDVHTWSEAAEITEVIVGAREWWDGVARNG